MRLAVCGTDNEWELGWNQGRAGCLPGWLSSASVRVDSSPLSTLLCISPSGCGLAVAVSFTRVPSSYPTAFSYAHSWSFHGVLITGPSSRPSSAKCGDSSSALLRAPGVPQPSLAPVSSAHVYGAPASAASSVTPSQGEPGWRLPSLSEWVGVLAISPHTQYAPVTRLSVCFCESPSSFLPLHLYTFLPLVPSQPPRLPSALSRRSVDAITYPPNPQSSFLSLSPLLSCKGRLVSDYLLCS